MHATKISKVEISKVAAAKIGSRVAKINKVASSRVVATAISKVAAAKTGSRATIVRNTTAIEAVAVAIITVEKIRLLTKRKFNGNCRKLRPGFRVVIARARA